LASAYILLIVKYRSTTLATTAFCFAKFLSQDQNPSLDQIKSASFADVFYLVEQKTRLLNNSYRM